MMNVNFMLVMVIVILVIAGLFGMVRGLVNSLAGLIALVLSIILVTVLMPVITSVFRINTPVYEQIGKRCEKVLDRVAHDIIRDGGGSFGGVLPEYFGAEDGPDSSMMTDFVLESLGKNDQTRLIQKLPVPDFVKEQMITYNNSEGYKKLNASSFKGYIVNYITGLIVNLLAFLVTLIVVWIIISIILMMLRVFSHLPVIGFVNAAGGLIIGLLKGVIFVWLIFLVFTLLPGLDISVRAMQMISENAFLTMLYNNNLFLRLVMRYIAGVL